MAAYFLPGIEVSVAVSLVVGLVIGTVMGFAGFASVWLFMAEILAFLLGGAIVLITQLVLTVMAGASLDLKAALLICLKFVFAEPAFVMFAVSIALAVAYLIRKATCTRPGI